MKVAVMVLFLYSTNSRSNGVRGGFWTFPRHKIC